MASHCSGAGVLEAGAQPPNMGLRLLKSSGLPSRHNSGCQCQLYLLEDTAATFVPWWEVGEEARGQKLVLVLVELWKYRSGKKFHKLIVVIPCSLEQRLGLVLKYCHIYPFHNLSFSPRFLF